MIYHFRFKVFVAAFAVIVCRSGTSHSIPWPVLPEYPIHSIGNTYGEYQYYGGYPYLHPGLDVLVSAGTPVYAVEAGWVKAVMTISADLHWRAAIGDSPGAEECNGWLYAHLEQSSIQVIPGEHVTVGQYLGDIVEWPVANFHHIHFVKIRNSGFPWESDWDFIANPLDELEGTLDPDPPVVQDCYLGQKFAFFENGTDDYFPPGSAISGDVDILVQLGDRINHPTWLLSPYTVAYEIYSETTTTGLIHSLTFTGQLFWLDNVNVIFQNDALFDTRGDYDRRIFYHIITNTDGDSVIEASDAAGCWETTKYTNGEYWVKVFVADRDGFDGVTYDVVDSMLVMVDNICECSDFCDLNLDGAINPVDVVYIVNYVYLGTDLRLQISTCPGDNGDWNCDGNVNPVDVVFYVNHVYLGMGSGPCDPCQP